MASPAPAANGSKRRRFTVDDFFTDHRPQAVGVVDLPSAKEIQLDRIEADPDQPRRTFDEQRLAELTDSIKIEGVLQPIVVRYHETADRYIVVHGERRWRAARNAGLQSIPALVRDVPEERRLIQQLMENVVREDLNALDRAAALRALKARLGDASWETVAESVGIRRSRLFQLLGTAKLPEEIQNDIRAGRLSEKQSRCLQGLSSNHQLAMRDAILAFEMNAEEARGVARSLRQRRVADDSAAAMSAIASIRSQPDGPRDARRQGDTAAVIRALGQTAELAGRRSTSPSGSRQPYDVSALRAGIQALTTILNAIPPDELENGTQSRSLLLALRSTLDSLLKS